MINGIRKCKSFFSNETRYDYTLTHAVLYETIFQIQKNKDAKSASASVMRLLHQITSHVLFLHPIEESFIPRIAVLRAKYLDKTIDVADMSLVLAAEDLQIEKIVTIDKRDFGFLTFKKGAHKKTNFQIILPEAWPQNSGHQLT